MDRSQFEFQMTYLMKELQETVNYPAIKDYLESKVNLLIELAHKVKKGASGVPDLIREFDHLATMHFWSEKQRPLFDEMRETLYEYLGLPKK